MSSATISPANAPDAARGYARALLDDLGVDAPIIGRADHPALAWRRSGLIAVTGCADGPALMCPAPITTAADGALLALAALADDREALPHSGALLLGERSRIMELRRRGGTSPNGSCRLVACRDGRIAVNLARDDDWDLLPAWLEAEVAPDWMAVDRVAASRSAATLVERGIAMGMAIAREAPPLPSQGWLTLQAGGRTRRNRRPRVVDFSALWAGPLAGSLLAMLGAEVIKVESATRPDGARRGHPHVFALLNGGKQHRTIDFADQPALAALVGDADIVIEGSRPRALRQCGIDAAAFVAGGGIWISITGHGRDGEAGDRVGFGDDAAVAAGLSHVMATGWGEPLFAGDAIADPLTGIHAALAGWALWRQGRSGLAALSLAGTVRHALARGAVQGATLREWQDMAEGDTAPLYPLRAC